MSGSAAAEFVHLSVLPEEVMSLFDFPLDKELRFIDCTVGGGGHSAALLEKYRRMELLGIDRDREALEAAAKRLSFAKSRVILRHGCFSEFSAFADELGWDKVDGMLFDLGVSSPQLDHAERGFSWRNSAALDMRMDQNSTLTASRLVNNASEEELERIFREYGEIQPSRRLAAEIVRKRQETPLSTTADLVEICDQVLRRQRPGAPPAPTLVFQALRIAVNDELGEIERSLPKVPQRLNEGGVVAVIAFHSLEDRIVKNFFRRESTECLCPPGLPICACGHKALLKQVTRKPLVAGKEELAHNRRSACAKLRAAKRI
jgi:16S rRNA (cytosine1402-N4)-methyltransferase